MVKGGSRIYTGRASRRRGGRPPSGRGTTSNPGPAQPSLRWAARERPARFGRRPPPWLAVEGYPPGPGRPRRCLRPTSRMPRARFRLDSMSGRAARAWPGLLAGVAAALARLGGREWPAAQRADLARRMRGGVRTRGEAPFRTWARGAWNVRRQFLMAERGLGGVISEVKHRRLIRRNL